MDGIFKKIKKCKKGNVLFEILTIIIILIACGFTYIIATSSITELTTDLKEDMDNNTPEYEVLSDYETRTPSILDGIIIFVFFGAWITALIFAYFIDTHPIFFVVSIIFLLIIVVLLVFLGNSSIEVLEEFTTTSYPMTMWLFNHILIVGVGIAISVLIALFAKPR